jgi:glycosyltransferase involved in cell wall biosynthesis
VEREGKEQPLVSAVIPARDAAAFVRDAIESVLNQSYANLECVVVDDGSVDETPAIASSYGKRVTLVSGDASGPASARNQGAAAAKGALLAFLDADDEWEPERTTRMVEVLRETGAEAALCATRRVGDEDSVTRLTPVPPTVESLLTWQGTVVSPSSNLLIERVAFEAMGGFHPRLSTAADWELLVRLAERDRLAYLDEALVRYRWHEGNMTRELDLTEADFERAYTITLERLGDRIPIPPRRARAGLHRMLATANLRLGRPVRGVRHALRALIDDPRVAVDAARRGPKKAPTT